ncbi:hypothetical protein LguiB_005401 [Lonicera macranthoides]
MVLCYYNHNHHHNNSNFILFHSCCNSPSSFYLHNSSSSLVARLSRRTRRIISIPNAKKSDSRKKRSWWEKFFFDDDGNWFGVKDEGLLESDELESHDDEQEELSEGEKFEAWRRRAEAIIELREAQEDMRNEENRRWEDWLVDDKGNGSSWVEDRQSGAGEDVGEEVSDIVPRKKFVESVRDLVLGREEDDLLYEDRVFRYASFNSASGWLGGTSLMLVGVPGPTRAEAKFLAVLILVPWALDFLVHDYVLMPFLDRYVKTVPLAAQVLDVRRSQKLEMVKELKVEKSRYQLEVEIGKSPPLSDTELWLELRHKALDLREKWRLENRRAFANIWSDMVFGISLFILLYFNQSQVALLKFTGYKIINNISDARKAFLIILVTDIFLGYHSECGWQTVVEIFLEHYGLDVEQSALTVFIGLVPVFLDACVKLWMLKFLPRFSPNVGNIIKEMKRH